MDWSQFFKMGGYGLYVWGSYLCALVAIGGEVLALNRRKKAIRQQTARDQRISASVLRRNITNETTS